MYRGVGICYNMRDLLMSIATEDAGCKNVHAHLVNTPTPFLREGTVHTMQKQKGRGGKKLGKAD